MKIRKLFGPGEDVEFDVRLSFSYQEWDDLCKFIMSQKHDHSPTTALELIREIHRVGSKSC